MNFRERIERSRNQDNYFPADEHEPEGNINPDYFGVENIRNSLSCIDLRLSDGSRKAMPYCYILEISFDASEGIEIITSTKQIKIKGRNLSRLYDSLIFFRVKYIQANIGTDTNEEGLFVKEIEIQEL